MTWFLFDENLSWTNNVEQIASKMSKELFALWQLTRLCGLETLNTMFLVHSHFP